VRKQRVRRDDYIRARCQLRQEGAAQQAEELSQFLQLVRRQRRETRQRRTSASVEAGRYAPDAALAISKLGLLFRGVFMAALGRVRNDRVDGIVILPFQPIEAVLAI
jgi:DNA-binding XRE family transcriptional regulator